jgi:hypothetical protein
MRRPTSRSSWPLALGIIVVVVVIAAIGIVVAGMSSSDAQNPRRDTQQAVVQKYVFEGYTQWSIHNPTQSCPNNLHEVADELGYRDTKDAWGNELMMFCGDDLPAGAAKDHFAVMSLGPDGTINTHDDIRSWGGVEHVKPTGGRVDRALDELRALKRQACECPDADCANKVETDFEDWMRQQEDTKGSQREAEQAGKLATDIQECVAKALAGGS